MTTPLTQQLAAVMPAVWEDPRYRQAAQRRRSRTTELLNGGIYWCSTCQWVYEPHGPNNIGCTACERYRTLTESAKTRRAKGRPGINLEATSFAVWFSEQIRECRYCHLPERLLPLMGFTTDAGHLVRRLGIDRVDNDRPYELGNIVLCCASCNSIKSDRPVSDMDVLGPAQQMLWIRKLHQLLDDYARQTGQTDGLAEQCDYDLEQISDLLTRLVDRLDAVRQDLVPQSRPRQRA